MSLSYILVGLATLAYCLYLYFTRTFNYWRDRNVAGPKAVPIFGNIIDTALRRKFRGSVYKQIYDDFPDEKVVGMYEMNSPCLLIRCPDIVKQVMIKDFDVFANRHLVFSNDVLADNLFHAEAAAWRILRNKLTPIFTSAKLKNMFHLMNETSDKFMKSVEKLIQTQPEQEVYGLMSKYTVMNIGSCALGLDLNMMEKSDIADTFNNLNKNLFTLSYTNELIMLFPALFKKLRVSPIPKEITHFFKSLVSQVVVARKGIPGNKKDLMDLLLEMKQSDEVQGSKRVEGEEADTLQITDNLMAAQAFIFYTGGYETSATTMANMLYELALNPDIQEKLVKEIEEVLERHDNEISYDSVMEITYLDRVFYETLRVHAFGTTVIRRIAATDYKIPGTNVTIKKGQPIRISSYGFHCDEKYWPDPMKFNPDRFSPENVAKRDPAVYLAFGIGPRNCIGMRFSKVQVRVLMVKLLRRFKLEATENTRKDLQLNPNTFIAIPIGGIKMKFLPRQESTPIINH